MATEKQLPPSRTADPEEEPSAKWGWHGGFPVATQVFGWFGAIVVFLMLTATHENHVSWVWIIGIGVAIVVYLLFDLYRKRTAWRR